MKPSLMKLSSVESCTLIKSYPLLKHATRVHFTMCVLCRGPNWPIFQHTPCIRSTNHRSNLDPTVAVFLYRFIELSRLLLVSIYPSS